MAPDDDPADRRRVCNAALGLIGAPLALVVTLGGGVVELAPRGRRSGADRLAVDPDGRPAGRDDATARHRRPCRPGKRATARTRSSPSLPSTGRLSFHNLDKVRGMHSDDEPDPLTDPAIELRVGCRRRRSAAPAGARGLGARSSLSPADRAGLSRERLWKVNSEMGGVRRSLEEEAMRLGWFTQLPSKVIGRSTAAGIGIAILGAGVIGLGVILPMSGAVLFGAALRASVAIGTVGFGQAMSKRSTQGAYVDAMLKAYRRTLQKTMDQARSMGEVIQQPEIAKLADTPDKAVVWGMALGLHDEVAAVLRPRPRGAAEGDRLTGRRLLPALARFELGLGLRLVGRIRGRPRRGRQRRFRQHLLRLRHP